MPPGFCLLAKHADAFLAETKAGGELDPAKLSERSALRLLKAVRGIQGRTQSVVLI